MASWMVVGRSICASLLLISGCSFARPAERGHDSHALSCSRASIFADLAGTGASGGAAVGLYAYAKDLGRDPSGDGTGAIIPGMASLLFGAISLTYAISATTGVAKHRRCHPLDRVHEAREARGCGRIKEILIEAAREQPSIIDELAEDARIRSCIDDHELASAWTIGAATAALRGDCKLAIEADARVMSLDHDHHRSVWSRDPTIQRCLAELMSYRVERERCIGDRAEALRRAQAITDLKGRTDAIRAVRECPPQR